MSPGRRPEAAPPPTRYREVTSLERWGRPSLQLRDLIYPQWYDIFVRVRFLEFYDAHRDLHSRDFAAFAARAARTEFLFQCLQIRYRKKGWWRWLRPVRAREMFRYRIRQFTELLERIRGDGFDPRYPIGIRLPIGPIVTREGKRFYRRYALGDGSHRLAVLLYLGYHELPANYWSPVHLPPRYAQDVTLAYLRAGRLSPAGHFEFLREYYGQPGHRDFEQLFTEEYAGVLAQDAGESAPVNTRLLELVRTLEVDWRALRLTPPAWFAPYARWAEDAEGRLARCGPEPSSLVPPSQP